MRLRLLEPALLIEMDDTLDRGILLVVEWVLGVLSTSSCYSSKELPGPSLEAPEEGL